MASLDTATAAYVSQRVASNLNIVDVTPQSKITLLTQGLLAEGTIFNNYTDEVLRNAYIQTADENFLDLIGASEGLVRTREPTLRLSKDDAIISLQLISGEGESVTIARNTVLSVMDDTVRMVVYEEASTAGLYGDLKEFLSVDIKNMNEDSNELTLYGGSYHDLSIGSSVYRLSVEKDISIPIIEESLDTFRSRVLYARQAATTGSESAIRLALSSINIIDSYTVDFSKNPLEVLIFNTSLLDSDLDQDSVKMYAAPVVNTKLNQVVSEGTSFTVSSPKKVDFSIKIAAKKNNIEIPTEVLSLREFIKKSYTLGSELRIDESFIREFLARENVSADFLNNCEITYYKNFLGDSYETSAKFINIHVDEYPFLSEVIVE